MAVRLPVVLVSGELQQLQPGDTITTALVGGLAFGDQEAAGITTGKRGGFWTCPYAGTISGWSLTVDAGTITVKIWKIADGTAKPTAANSINTSGLSLSSGTHIRSATLTDFTTLAVAIGDVFAVEVTAASGVTDFAGTVEITRS
jgi:hypothetical protein